MFVGSIALRWPYNHRWQDIRHQQTFLAGHLDSYLSVLDKMLTVDIIYKFFKRFFFTTLKDMNIIDLYNFVDVPLPVALSDANVIWLTESRTYWSDHIIFVKRNSTGVRQITCSSGISYVILSNWSLSEKVSTEIWSFLCPLWSWIRVKAIQSSIKVRKLSSL